MGATQSEDAKSEGKKPVKDVQATQETSYLKEQATYWKTFVSDLFVGTLKRIVISPIVFGLAFGAIAYLIYRLSIKPQHLFFLLKFLEVLILYLVYLVIGILSGLIHGANSTLSKKTEELEKGVHLIVNPLMAAIIGKMPGGQESMTIEEFNTLLDEQINRFKKKSPFRLRLLSLAGMFSRFFLRMTLRILRYMLLHDFLGELEEKGETQVSAKVVEVYYREKLVSGITGVFTEKLELVQKGIYAVLVVFLAIPVALMVIF